MDTEAPLLTVTDPEFCVLRADTRGFVDAAELDCRAAMGEFLDRLPRELRAIMEPLRMEFPARFLRALAPFIKAADEMRSQDELTGLDQRGRPVN